MKPSRGAFGDRCAGRLGALDVVGTHLFRPRRDERCVLSRRRVPQISKKAHHLVVAEQRVHGPARPLRVLLHRVQQVERLERIGAAIDHVAELDEVRAPAHPALAIVDETRRTQDLDEAIVGAVHVADGHDAVDAGELTAGRRRGRPRRTGAGGGEQREDGDEVSSNPGCGHDETLRVCRHQMVHSVPAAIALVTSWRASRAPGSHSRSWCWLCR